MPVCRFAISAIFALLLSSLLIPVSLFSAQPNIVFFFCDDLASQAISAYGHKLKLLDTPNMDRLAA